ncbi:DUF3857 domain-containing protein [Sphingomonas sp. SRS2]|uniref:DUF3857 domain-containing protein n=1 Tax=Sphingomonas sp. SRS2 TaxID=133190 RepID=UPI0006964FF1|nr:DUF3857 domain-containing protein [Sphingomonas sp. SRS2]
MKIWAIAIATTLAAPVYGGEQILFGPAPSWVRPVAPATVTPDGGSVSYLLSDEQYRLEPGRIGSYEETVWRIENPEGFGTGNVSLSWQPEIHSLTINKLTIRRGDRVIDVLKSGQSFSILRREANLESAMLDGTLTATLQPEDLQVGDIIELASTIVSTDPIYRTHVEAVGDADFSVKVGRKHFSAEWPAAVKVRLRQTEGLPALTPKQSSDMAKVEFTLDDLMPTVTTSHAPARFRRPRLIEFSDFNNWSELAALFAPMYDKVVALRPGSPLQAEVDRIKALSSDPVVRTEAALTLVQGRVRYVALLMGTGNFAPADPAVTWSRRFGDCKAKSAMLVAMLRAMDINAAPVIVNTYGNDGLDQRLPMLRYFNHVIVRATIRGKDYWLDGTRTGDLRLDQLGTPDYDWGLPLVQDAGLVRMLSEQLALPEADTQLRIDARAGISSPAPVQAEIVLRGDDAYGMQQSVANLTADQRDKWVRDYWVKRYPFIQVKTAGQSYDANKREQRLTMDGIATMDWRGGVYWLTDSDVGFKNASLERGPGENRDAPYSVRFPYFVRATETLLLPPGVKPVNVEPVDQIAGGIHFVRTADLTGSRFTAVTSMKSVAREFAASEAPSAQQTMRALADHNPALRASVESHAPRTAQQEPADASAGRRPMDAFTLRGFELLGDMDFDGASAAFETALKRDANNVRALAGRGLILAWYDDFNGAARDLNAAAVLDPEDPYVLRNRGYLAQKQKRHAEAIRFYTRVLQTQPDDHVTYGWRAEVYHLVGDDAAAIRDAHAATKLSPGWADMYFLRARIYQKAREDAKAFAEAEAAIAAAPENSFAHYQAAIIYNEGGRKDAALKAINRAIEIRPGAEMFVSRMFMRADDDLASKRQDIEAALRFDPSNLQALREKAALQDRTGDPMGGAATLAIALREQPQDSQLLTLRAELLSQAGHKGEAARSFTAARVTAKSSTDFDLLCWNHALTDIDLPTALQDCEVASAKTPDDYLTLKSLALVKLKLGKTDEAIESYSRSLALEPDNAGSLFGRAVAWQRKGDAQKAKADRDAALAADPGIAATAQKAGLTFSDAELK